MKAEELMKGDFVLATEKDRYGEDKPCLMVVELIDVKDAVLNTGPFRHGVAYDKIKPVKITRRWLFDNHLAGESFDFVSKFAERCHCLIDENTNISFLFMDGVDDIGVEFSRAGVGSFSFRGSLKYVHEVQHLFKLCGVEYNFVL